MSKEGKVVQVLSPKLSDSGWKTVRFALGSWARTARLMALFLALSLPSVAIACVFLSKWL